MADREKHKRFQGIDLYGSNDMPSLENFNYRRAYANLFPTHTETGFELPETIDFWNNPGDTFYGRINHVGNVIIPNTLRMKPISTFGWSDSRGVLRTEPIYVFDFVADAFNQFQKYMHFGAPAQKIKGSPWEDLKPHRGWFNINDGYGSFFQTAIVGAFSDAHLYENKNSLKITNAKQYVDEFFENFVYRVVKSFPITQTGYMLSGMASVLDTALCIDLSKEDSSRDFKKFDEWVKDPSFDYFRYEAARHGFMIDKNAPWRLVANLASHQMRMMMKMNNVLDEYYFDVYYKKSLYQDVNLLKFGLLEGYNKFVSRRPFETKPKETDCRLEAIDERGSSRRKADLVMRGHIDMKSFEKLFDSMYWYEKYFHLRVREAGIYVEGDPFNNKLFNRHVKKLSLINKYVDSRKVLEYIDNYVKKRWKPFVEVSSTKKPVSIATPPSGAPFIGKTGIGTKKNDTGNY